jgi:serine/threonine-protein kinase HipA
MAVNGRATGITRADLIEVGDRFAVPSVADTIQQVLESVGRWSAFASEAGVPEPVARSVGDDIQAWSSPLRTLPHSKPTG